MAQQARVELALPPPSPLLVAEVLIAHCAPAYTRDLPGTTALITNQLKPTPLLAQISPFRVHFYNALPCLCHRQHTLHIAILPLQEWPLLVFFLKMPSPPTSSPFPYPPPSG